MNAATAAPPSLVFVLVLGAAALLVLVLASWLGRWPLWVLGYLLMVAAVIASFGAVSP